MNFAVLPVVIDITVNLPDETRVVLKVCFFLLIPLLLLLEVFVKINLQYNDKFDYSISAVSTN